VGSHCTSLTDSAGRFLGTSIPVVFDPISHVPIRHSSIQTLLARYELPSKAASGEPSILSALVTGPQRLGFSLRQPFPNVRPARGIHPECAPLLLDMGECQSLADLQIDAEPTKKWLPPVTDVAGAPQSKKSRKVGFQSCLQFFYTLWRFSRKMTPTDESSVGRFIALSSSWFNLIYYSSVGHRIRPGELTCTIMKRKNGESYSHKG
jgi:hypothetical protein